MTHLSSISAPTIPFRHTALAVGGALAALVVLAATPLGALLLTDAGGSLLTVLPTLWVAAAAAVDLCGWRAYSPRRRAVSFLAWTVFGLGGAPWLG